MDNRDQLFLDIIAEASHTDHTELAELAGVSKQTLHNWCFGKTMKPRIDTLTKVARALGYEIVLRKVRAGKANLRRVA